MSSERQTVAACVFQGHPAAGHDRHECPLVQVLTRRVRAAGIEDSPAYVDRELDKYRALARVLSCPLLAKVTLDDLITRSLPGARYARLPTPRAPLRHSELQCQLP
jgi:hypothetical protein